MIFGFIIIAIIAGYLRRSLQTAATMPQWNKRLLWLMYIAIALIFTQFFFFKNNSTGQWLAILMLSGLIYILYTDEKFRPARFLVTAIAPYTIALFITAAVKLLNTDLYNQWHARLNTIIAFAIIWAFGTWFVTNRQQKELIKARKKAIEEEQNNKVIMAVKAQLEVQVAERTSELTKQKEELEIALNDLKSTQVQLIQSEKMASLGELTAGIAHEIQNPLNFVNNFSEVNTELVDELQQEAAKGNINEIRLIANNIKENEQKINHHGKRADAIVKGMLQHSRQTKGVKELIDINALADEYLRLSYHGLRAKDKEFNVTIKTDFDESLFADKAGIGKISIVPQDIGRVLLNLYNNAFYAVNEKNASILRQAQNKPGSAGQQYVPTVSIGTKALKPPSGSLGVSIFVSDNGNGIPQNIIDKIFQPFFTTKPTGQGTGLGLSLSYDIIKAHGGKIKVESKKGEGSEFVIQLPAS